MGALPAEIRAAVPGQARPSRLFRGLIWALLLSVVGASIMVANWFADEPHNEPGIQVLVSLLVMGTMGALAAARYAIMRGRMVVVMRIASLALFAGLGILGVAIVTILDFTDYSGFDVVWHSGFTLLLIGGAIAHHGVFRLLPSPTWVITVLRWLVMIGAAVVTVLSLVVIWDPYWGPSWTLIMVLPGLLFAAIAGTVIVPIAAVMRAGRDRRVKESLSSDVKLEFTCPGCAIKTVASPGIFRCKGCAFALMLDIEEPRCACGYLLFKLVGDACPECGRGVPTAIAPTAENRT